MITIQGLKLLDYHLTVDATTTRCDYHSIFAGTLRDRGGGGAGRAIALPLLLLGFIS